MTEVSVIIPVLNEERYITKCIETIIDQDYTKEKLEVLFVDGMSTDNTLEILKKAAEQYSWIRILENEKKIIPCALNIGIRAAEGEYIIRMDAHAEYAPDYISKNIEVIRETGADNVGGPVIARGNTRRQRAIAAAYSSPFAFGGGEQYKSGFEGYVKTVFLGCYKKATAVKLGLYDERMARNEDDEFNFRLALQGGKVYMSPRIRTVYYPRDSFVALARQYFGYGEGKPKVLRKHGKPQRITQIIPSLFVLFLIIGAIASAFSGIARVIYGAVLLLYLLMDLWFSFSSKAVTGIKEKLLLAWAHCVIHVSYGYGYLKGLLFPE